MHLTKEDREKFAAYCDQQVNENDRLAKLAEMPGSGLVRYLRIKALNYAAVAADLRDVAEDEIGS